MAHSIWPGHWYWVSMATLFIPLPVLGSTQPFSKVPLPVSPEIQSVSSRGTSQQSSGLVDQDYQASQPTPSSTGLRDHLHRELIPNASDYSFGPAADYLPQADFPPTVAPQATQIVLRLAERKVYVYDDEQVLASYPVAIGASDTPTPTGEFEVFQMIVDPSWENPWTGEVFPPGPDSALGVRWIGFVEQSNGIIGFHGTPTLDSIGQAASNGCVRMRNEDVVALFAYAQMGMTVIVEP